MAGERFAVRNSGVDTVVEAVGDHGCEYMTGGRVVVLGPTGRNFAAGMSGGIAYLLDESNESGARINAQMVDIERVEDPAEADALRALIEKHVLYTGSEHAKGILAAWATKLPKFVRVIPKDYKRALACLKRAHDQGLSGDEAIMAAFEENARDLSRVGGN
jgi:glutamate synthase domain-containing protein 3